MLNNTVTDNFNYQEILSAFDKMDRFNYNKPIAIKVSFDFYQKIKNNITEINYKKVERFFGLPIIIDKNLNKNYEFVYEEDRNATK